MANVVKNPSTEEINSIVEDSHTTVGFSDAQKKEMGYKRQLDSAKRVKTASSGVGGKFNIINDAKDVSRGLEGVGSAMSGNYKKMDTADKKKADLDTAAGVKAAASYTGVGKPIVAAINTAESTPIIGGAVKKIEQKIGGRLNRTMSRYSNMPITGGLTKRAGGLVSSVGGTTSQVLNGEKAAYNQKQKANIKAASGNIGIDGGIKNISSKAKLNSQSDQMSAKAALSVAKNPNPLAASGSKGSGANNAMNKLAGQSTNKGGQGVKKAIWKAVLPVLGAIAPFVGIFFLALCAGIIIAGILGAYSGNGGVNNGKNFDSNIQQEFCTEDKEFAKQQGIDCDKTPVAGQAVNASNPKGTGSQSQATKESQGEGDNAKSDEE